MLSHLVVSAEDLDASRAFYDATLNVLDVGPGILDDGRRYFYVGSGMLLVVSRPINNEPASHANGGTIGFAAASRAQVDAWHAAGIAHGGTSCEDPPGPRKTDAGEVYAAYLRDPSGNKLCAVHGLGG